MRCLSSIQIHFDLIIHPNPFPSFPISFQNPPKVLRHRLFQYSSAPEKEFFVENADDVVGRAFCGEYAPRRIVVGCG